MSFHRLPGCPPCVLHEDEHLLVINKPAGINTHAPAPFAGEGIYDWLRHRESRWAQLAILHRLDKETSGVLVFGKTTLANKSLTDQFTRRLVRKKYLLLSRRAPSREQLMVKSRISRAGARYASGANGELAETRFRLVAEAAPIRDAVLIEAEPLTGRTHQIRVHAAENGFAVLGDTVYGGEPFGRACLHSAELTCAHPASGESITFRAPVDFMADPHEALRNALIDPRETDSFRLIHGAGDGRPGWYIDKLGPFLLAQSGATLTNAQVQELTLLTERLSLRGAYQKELTTQVRGIPSKAASPVFVAGEAATERFVICENGVRFELSFQEGYSVGLFLDQRDNRRRLLTGHVAAGFDLLPERRGSPLRVLNTFAYTCAFSVCAARFGATVTSLDLSRKYLDWGRRNFELNDLDPVGHDFIYGDVFDWLRRLAKKGRVFDLIILDPPTFSQSKQLGVFRVEKDYGRLVDLALPLLDSNGVLLASTNAAGWQAQDFVAVITGAMKRSGRAILQSHYVTQPPDFPINRLEPAFLKAGWLRLE